ncbi:ankyrin, partial [Corynespora cassiicola Philippines]
VDKKDQDGWTPLHWAAWGGHETVVRLLIDHGANIDAKSTERETVLHLAASGGNEAVAQLLVDSGAD